MVAAQASPLSLEGFLSLNNLSSGEDKAAEPPTAFIVSALHNFAAL
jgi:hypothetical protein